MPALTAGLLILACLGTVGGGGEGTGTVRERVVRTWPGDDAKVQRVVECETGGTWNPQIRSRTGKYWGLFQADADFRRAYGWGNGTVEDQTRMAWRGYQARGWSPWPRCGKR